MRKGRWDWGECRKAIHLVEMLVRADQYTIGPSAETGLSRLGHDETDVVECLTAIREDEVSKFEEDADFDGKHILALEHRTDIGTIYVKVSIRLDKDHHVLVRSYHRSGM